MNILQQIQQESIKRELANRLNFEKAEQNSLISQVQDDVLKGMSEEEILEKARAGKYADTPENRKLGRVGQQYGSKKTDTTSTDKKEGKSNVWSKDQDKAIADNDKKFADYLKEKNIDPYSKEASKEWHGSIWQKRQKEILGKDSDDKKDSKVDITSTDKEKIKEGFKNPHGMNISNDPETRQAVANHAKDYIKKLHEERKAKKESGGSYADSDEHRVKSGEYGAAREKGYSHEKAQEIANNHWEKVKNEYSK